MMNFMHNNIMQPIDFLDFAIKSRARWRSLDSQLRAVDENCKKNHRKPSIYQCSECLYLQVRAYRDRFLDSKTNEWYHSNPEFVARLDDSTSNILAKIKKGSTQQDIEDIAKDVSALNRRVRSERNFWLRLAVRNSYSINLLVKEFNDPVVFRKKIDDNRHGIETIMANVAEVMEKAEARMAHSPTNVKTFVERLEESKSDEERASIHIELLTSENGKPLEQTDVGRQVLDMIQAQEPLDKIINEIAEMTTSADTTQRDTDRCLKRLEELRRAKTAFEAQLRTKQAERAAAEAAKHALTIPSALWQRTSCSACSEPISERDWVEECATCLYLVYKSVPHAQQMVLCGKCAKEGSRKDHFQQEHACWSGTNCLSKSEALKGKENWYYCRECITQLKKCTTFCSLSCAAANFQPHRDDVHVPKRMRLDLTVDDAMDIEYEDERRTSYHAKDIAKHLLDMEEETEAMYKHLAADGIRDMAPQDAPMES